MKQLRSLSFPLFLASFVISFFLPVHYKFIVFIEFMILGPLVVFLYYQNRYLSQTAQIIFILFTAISLLFGVPGSALGYLVSASIGLFVAQSGFPGNHQQGRVLITISCTFLIASLYLLYSNFSVAFTLEQISDYFGEASINYASLTVASFSSIFASWCVMCQLRGAIQSKSQLKALRIISGILSLTFLAMAVIFSTRSALLGFLPCLLYSLQPKRPYVYFALFVILCAAIYLIFPLFSEFILLLLAPGRENLSDLYSTELKGQERSEAALFILEVAIPKMSLCINCSDYLSYSGLSNLLALSFPFSLFYLYQIVRFLFSYINNYFFGRELPKILLLILGISFINSFLLALFQADFLSTVSLFYVIGLGFVAFQSRSLVFTKKTKTKKGGEFDIG